jgi:phage major head subunit gpT-like protein
MTSMLPALDEVIFHRFTQHPPQYTKIFRVLDSNRSIEQTSDMADLGTFVEIPEGGDMRYDFAKQGFDKTYTHAQFGLGYKVSRIMVDDDRFGVIKKLAGSLGRSARETIELHAAADLNNGFSTNGLDGVPLFSSSHPLIKSGGTENNTLAVAADLDIPSLELALTDFRTLVDPTGKKIRLIPELLVIPPQLEFVAAEMLKGSMRSDTANNTVNAFKNRVGISAFDNVMVYEYLTDPDAWFIRGPKEDTELRFYWRERPGTVHDIHFDSRTIKTAMWMRFSHGHSGWYGWYGVPGA